MQFHRIDSCYLSQRYRCRKHWRNNFKSCIERNKKIKNKYRPCNILEQVFSIVRVGKGGGKGIHSLYGENFCTYGIRNHYTLYISAGRNK